MRVIALLALCVCTASALAQSAATKEFPADAQSLSVDELKQTLSGKVFIKNDAWWAANLDKTVQRFKEWQLAG